MASLILHPTGFFFSKDLRSTRSTPWNFHGFFNFASPLPQKFHIYEKQDLLIYFNLLGIVIKFCCTSLWLQCRQICKMTCFSRKNKANSDKPGFGQRTFPILWFIIFGVTYTSRQMALNQILLI